MAQTNREPGRTNRIPIWVDLLASMLLGALALKSLYGFQAVIDLGVADEAVYLTRGVYLGQAELNPQWAPLYSIWYYLLNTISGLSDNVRLYDTNYLVLSIIGPLLLYTYLRRIDAAPVVALVAAALYLISYSNLGVTPYQGKFAVVCVLLALIATTFLPRRLHYTVLLIALLLLAYIRPEYALSFVAAAVLAVGLVVYRVWRQGLAYLKVRSLWLQAAVLLVLVVVSAQVMGNPLRGGRSDSAFKQHFAINYVAWGLADTNPWSQADDIAQEAFGDADSIPAMALNNVPLFARHLLTNAARYPQNLAITSALTPYLPRHLGPPAAVRSVSLAVAGFLLLGFIAAVVLIWRKPGGSSAGGSDATAAAGRYGYAARLVGAFLLFISIPNVISSLVVYPRFHYLQLQALLLLILLAILVSSALAAVRRNQSTARSVLVMGAAALFLMALTPNLARGWSWPKAATPMRADIRGTVNLLRSLDIEDPVTFMSYTRTNFSFNVYFDTPFTPVSPAATDDLRGFLRDQNINMIIWPDSVQNEVAFRDNEQFRQLLADPAAYGFAELFVPDATWKGSSRVLIAPSLVAELPATGGPQAGAAPAQSVRTQWERAGALMAGGQTDQALALYRDLVNADPANRAGRMTLAAALVQAGRDADALAEYAAISQRWPDFPWAYTRRGEILERTGDLPGAILAFETAVQLAPNDPNTHVVLAYAYRHAGLRDQAIASFEAALALDPERPAARRVLEELRSSEGD